MPTTRRSTSGSKSGAGGKQATLSFHNRVTKSVPRSSKDLVTSTTPKNASPLSKHVSPAPEEVEAEEPEDTTPVVEEAPAKSPAELRAEKIKDKQIREYWNKTDEERIAKRVHQDHLSLEEKVLRYFDVSNQYGPCVGISRMKRWQRADRLGLNPPIEVLAVLLKQESHGAEHAHMDNILNSTAVGAV